MYQNSLNWYVTLSNPTNQQSNIIENGFRNHKRRAYLTIINSSHGAQNQMLFGIIELNQAHSLNWLQQYISPIPNWKILQQNPNQAKQLIRNYIDTNTNLYSWTLIDDGVF
jgi:c-di-AMP phosphodiesterase-like protein